MIENLDSCPNCGEKVSSLHCNFCDADLVLCKCGLLLPAIKTQCPYCHRSLSGVEQPARQIIPASQPNRFVSGEETTTDRIVRLETGEEIPAPISEHAVVDEPQTEESRVVCVLDSHDDASAFDWRSFVRGSAIIPTVIILIILLSITDQSRQVTAVLSHITWQTWIIGGISIIWLIACTMAYFTGPYEW
jgi:hypothetical protein